METGVYLPSQVGQAASLLRGGDLVAFPTETVYGLGAALWVPGSLSKIYSVKRRPFDNPLIVHIGVLDDLHSLAESIPDEAFSLARAFWPGPLTLVLRRHSKVPAQVSAGLPSIAVRMPAHPLALELIWQTAMPVAAPSANLSGRPSATCVEHVLHDLNGAIAAVLDGGASPLGLESTVLSLLDPDRPKLLRPGEIQQEEMEKILGKKIQTFTEGDQIVSPGLKYRHYAPEGQLHLFEQWDALQQHLQQDPLPIRMILATESPPFPTDIPVHLLSRSHFYHCLRTADLLKVQQILVRCCDKVRSDLALMNRLLRAAGKGEPGF